MLWCNLAVLLGLALFAAREQGRLEGAFNTAVAAETIVAFGVLTLILGLVTALMPYILNSGQPLTFDTRSVRSVGLPFAQGLVSAGIAPVIAVLVRINGAGKSDDAGPDDADLLAAEALRQAMAQLAAELGGAKSAAAKLNKALADAAVGTARIAPDIATHLDAVVQAAGRVAPAIDTSLAGAATAIGDAGATLAGEMTGAARQVAGSFGDVQARTAALAAATQDNVAELGRLHNALGKVTANADEFAGLLDTLNTLTASVESFLARRQAP